MPYLQTCIFTLTPTSTLPAPPPPHTHTHLSRHRQCATRRAVAWAKADSCTIISIAICVATVRRRRCSSGWSGIGGGRGGARGISVSFAVWRAGPFATFSWAPEVGRGLGVATCVKAWAFLEGYTGRIPCKLALWISHEQREGDHYSEELQGEFETRCRAQGWPRLLYIAWF